MFSPSSWCQKRSLVITETTVLCLTVNWFIKTAGTIRVLCSTERKMFLCVCKLKAFQEQNCTSLWSTLVKSTPFTSTIWSPIWISRRKGTKECSSEPVGKKRQRHLLSSPLVQLQQTETRVWRCWCICQVSGWDHCWCWCRHPWRQPGWEKPSSPWFLCLRWTPSQQRCSFSPESKTQAKWKKGWKCCQMGCSFKNLINIYIEMFLTPDSDTYRSTNCHLRGSSDELQT